MMGLSLLSLRGSPSLTSVKVENDGCGFKLSNATLTVLTFPSAHWCLTVSGLFFFCLYIFILYFTCSCGHKLCFQSQTTASFAPHCLITWNSRSSWAFVSRLPLAAVKHFSFSFSYSYRLSTTRHILGYLQVHAPHLLLFKVVLALLFLQLCTSGPS